MTRRSSSPSRSSSRRSRATPSSISSSNWLRSYRRTLQTDRRHLLEEFQLRPGRPQGGGRRERRDPGLGPPARGPRQQRPAHPPGQGSGGVGARGVRRQERVRQPRRAGGGRPAPDAGGQRHLPRLAAGRRARRGDPRLLRPPAPRLEGLRRGRTVRSRRPEHVRRHVRRDAGPGPRPLGRPDRHRRAISAPARRSTGPSSSSPRPTPTRTSATTSPSSRPRPAGGSRWSQASSHDPTGPDPTGPEPTRHVPATPLPTRTTPNTSRSTAITVALFCPSQDFQFSRMPWALSPRLTMTTRGAATPMAPMMT